MQKKKKKKKKLRVSMKNNHTTLPGKSQKTEYMKISEGLKSTSNESAHEIMALFVFRKLILQTRMRSHPVALDVWFLVRLSSTSILHVYEQRRLCGCAGSPEPLLFAYVISTIISWAGSNILGGCWRMWYMIYENRPHRRHFTVHCLQWSITFFDRIY